ncbi:MAG: type III-B CRISPR module RAMP protein Cmr1 [Sulfolobales archaeon]
MSSWLNVQREIAQRDWIAEIKVENITPVRIGGYNARPYSSSLNLMEQPRTQNIKGLWRWWARAILAGAILGSKGSLAGGLSDIDKEVSRLLGSTNASSEFFIQTTLNSDPKIIPYNELENVPRVKLITMGISNEEKRLEQYYQKLSLSIFVGARKGVEKHSRDSVMFALSSLIIALIFSGIGSITTRGFGKLKIIDIEPKSPAFRNDIDNLNQLLKSLYKQNSEQGITEVLKKLISVSLEYALGYLSLEKISPRVKISEIPLYSVLLLNSDPEVFRLETICISRLDPMSLLECLGESTLKMRWKQKKCLSPRSPGKNLHTWVLGLPRYQEPPYRRDGRRERLLTGYVILNSREEKEEKRIRRQSPIGFTVLECSGGLAIVMYGFLTSEYPQLLEGRSDLVLQHVGIHATRSSLRIDRTNVYNDILNRGISFPHKTENVSRTMPVEDVYRLVFNAAWEFIKQIIKEGIIECKDKRVIKERCCK